MEASYQLKQTLCVDCIRVYLHEMPEFSQTGRFVEHPHEHSHDQKSCTVSLPGRALGMLLGCAMARHVQPVIHFNTMSPPVVMDEPLLGVNDCSGWLTVVFKTLVFALEPGTYTLTLKRFDDGRILGTWLDAHGKVLLYLEEPRNLDEKLRWRRIIHHLARAL